MKKLNLVLAGAAFVGAAFFTSCSKTSDDFLTSKNKTTVDDDNEEGEISLDIPGLVFLNLSEGLDGVLDISLGDIELDTDLGEREITSFYGIDTEGDELLSFLDQEGNVIAEYDYDFEDGKLYEVVLTGDGVATPYEIEVLELDYDMTSSLTSNEEDGLIAVNGLNLTSDIDAVSIQTELDNGLFGTTIPGLADLQIDAEELSTTTTIEDPIEYSTRIINSGSELTEDLVDGVLVSIGSKEIFNEDSGIIRLENGEAYSVFVLGDASETELFIADLSSSWEDLVIVTDLDLDGEEAAE